MELKICFYLQQTQMILKYIVLAVIASTIWFYIDMAGYYLERICHQIIATNETEDGDVVVVIDYSERTKNLIQRRTLSIIC